MILLPSMFHGVKSNTRINLRGRDYSPHIDTKIIFSTPDGQTKEWDFGNRFFRDIALIQIDTLIAKDVYNIKKSFSDEILFYFENFDKAMLSKKIARVFKEGGSSTPITKVRIDFKDGSQTIIEVVNEYRITKWRDK